MVTITAEKIKDMYSVDLLYRLHVVKEKCKLFSKKYGMDFPAFEGKVKSNSEEVFEEWDDYLEWKGYTAHYNNLLKEQEEIKNGNFKVT